MNDQQLGDEALAKVPAITLGFWIIKILATTLGETGGDTVTMTWLARRPRTWSPNGYLIGTAIFGVLLIGLVCADQARSFNPWLYWATIVARRRAGTTLADFADRSLGIGYLGGSLLLLSCVLLSLAPGTGRSARRRQHGRQCRRRRLLLGHDHLLADAWNRARGLGRGRRAWLFGWGAGVRRSARCWRSLLRDQDQPRFPVLGGVHSDPAAGCDGWRLPRQAGRQGRTGVEPAARERGARDRNPRFDHAPTAASGPASG